MPKHHCNFIQRMLILFLFCLLIVGCTKTPEPMLFEFTPIIKTALPTVTVRAERPFWEVTPTPSSEPPTATPVPLKDAPPPTSEANIQTSGEELFAYLPRLADVPSCQSLNYVIHLTTASAECSLIPVGNLSISITISSSPYSSSSLILPASYHAIKADAIGDSSIAGQSERGDSAMVVFIKNREMVTISSTISGRVVDPQAIFKIANIIEKHLPASIHPAGVLSFPQTPRLDDRKSYFSDIQFAIKRNGRFLFTSNFQSGDNICVYVAPLKTAYDQLWTIVLYDVQKAQVAQKMMMGMYAQNICSGLEPEYADGKFIVGDRYEIRIAANDEWVATFPVQIQ